MRCEDRGPDLLARAQSNTRSPPLAAPAQPGPADADRLELEQHLAGCDACRAELSRVEAELRALAAASAAPAAPPAALRARILAAVRDEAAERRADAAVAAAASCPAVRDDIPALVLGQLAPDDAARTAAHLSACAPCDDERRATERLVATHRAALAPAAAPDALRSRLLAAVRADAAVHLPPAPEPLRLVEARRARVRARRISYLVPLAAAASLLATIVLGSPAVGLHVQDDVGAILVPGCRAPGAVASRKVDRSAGELRLAEGDGVRAGSQAVDVRLRIGGRAAADPDAAPGAGEVRVRLQPGTFLVRAGDAEFELESGRISVHAGPLDTRLTLRHGRTYAAIVGTEFDASVVGDRLIVSVEGGRVAVGRTASADGAAATAETVVGPGTDALVDETRLLTRRSDGSSAADAFLAPRLELAAPTGPSGASDAVIEATLTPGAAGPVTISAFDDSDPRVLIRLKGPDGRTVEAKVQRSMLADDLPAAPTVRLEEGRPYRLRLRLAGLSLVPGAWEARVRYQSYGTRTDGSEWHGTVESGPVSFEVTSK